MTSRFRAYFSLTLALLYFSSQVVLATAAETNFWSQRRKAVQVGQSESNLTHSDSPDSLLLASLPSATRQLPSVNLPRATSFDSAIRSSLLPQITKIRNKQSHDKIVSIVESIPTNFGSVRKLRIPAIRDSKKIVIHVQDVHQNGEAQEKIASTVEALISKKKVDLIAVEGAFSDIDLSHLRKSNHRNLVKQAAKFLLKADRISGPIYSVVVTPHAIPSLVGIDDSRHYQLNVEAYRKSAHSANAAKNQIKSLLTKCTEEKGVLFNSELMAFDSKVAAYQEGRVSLSEYILHLSKETGVRSPYIDDFVQAFSLESRLNFHEVERERSALITNLAARLNKQEMRDLLEWSTAYRVDSVDHASFYRRLEDICSRHEISLSKFPAMNSYIRYVLLSNQIEPDALFDEIKMAEDRIYADLVQSEKETELLSVSKKLRFAAKLVDFSLTPKEWREYKSIRAARIEGDLQGLATFESFYREAEIRDRSMVSNVLRAMEREDAKTAILVTGGFHSLGIDEALNDSGVSIVSFTPRITKIESQNGAAYLSAFMQEKTPLEKLFEGQRLFLAQNPSAGLGLIPFLGVALKEAETRTVDVPTKDDQKLFDELRREQTTVTTVEARDTATGVAVRTSDNRVGKSNLIFETSGQGESVSIESMKIDSHGVDIKNRLSLLSEDIFILLVQMTAVATSNMEIAFIGWVAFVFIHLKNVSVDFEKSGIDPADKKTVFLWYASYFGSLVSMSVLLFLSLGLPVYLWPNAIHQASVPYLVLSAIWIGIVSTLHSSYSQTAIRNLQSKIVWAPLMVKRSDNIPGITQTIQPGEVRVDIISLRNLFLGKVPENIYKDLIAKLGGRIPTSAEPVLIGKSNTAVKIIPRKGELRARYIWVFKQDKAMQLAVNLGYPNARLRGEKPLNKINRKTQRVVGLEGLKAILSEGSNPWKKAKQMNDLLGDPSGDPRETFLEVGGKRIRIYNVQAGTLPVWVFDKKNDDLFIQFLQKDELREPSSTEVPVTQVSFQQLFVGKKGRDIAQELLSMLGDVPEENSDKELGKGKAAVIFRTGKRTRSPQWFIERNDLAAAANLTSVKSWEIVSEETPGIKSGEIFLTKSNLTKKYAFQDVSSFLSLFHEKFGEAPQRTHQDSVTGDGDKIQVFTRMHGKKRAWACSENQLLSLAQALGAELRNKGLRTGPRRQRTASARDVDEDEEDDEEEEGAETVELSPKREAIKKIYGAFNELKEIPLGERKKLSVLANIETLTQLDPSGLRKSFPTPEGHSLRKTQALGIGRPVSMLNLIGIEKDEKGVFWLHFDYETTRGNKGTHRVYWNASKKEYVDPKTHQIKTIVDAFRKLEHKPRVVLNLEVPDLIDLERGEIRCSFPSPKGGNISQDRALGSGLHLESIILREIEKDSKGVIWLKFEFNRYGETGTCRSYWDDAQSMFVYEKRAPRSGPRKKKTALARAIETFRKYNILDLAVTLSSNPTEMQQALAILLFQEGVEMTEQELAELSRALVLNLREGGHPGNGGGFQPGNPLDYLRALMALQAETAAMNEYDQLILIKAFVRIAYPQLAKDYEGTIQEVKKTLKEIEDDPLYSRLLGYVEQTIGQGLKYQPSHVTTPLLPHQRVGAWHLRNSEAERESGIFGFLLEDDTRMGKTIQTFAAMDPSWKVVIAVPSSVMDTWQEQFQQHTNRTMEIVPVRGTPAEKRRRILENADKKGCILLVSIEDLRGKSDEEFSALNQGLDLVVVDEGQRIENYGGQELQTSSLQAKAIHRLLASRRWILSASPYTSHPRQLFSVFNLLHTNPETGETTNDLYANRRSFNRLLAGGLRQLKWLYALKARIGLRRTKAEMGQLYTTKREIDPNVEGKYEVSAEQGQLVLRIIKNLGDYLRIYNERVAPENRIAERSIGVFLKLLFLNWALTEPAILGENLPTQFWDSMDKIVKKRLETGKKGIIFAQNTAMIDRIVARYEAQGHKVARIDGTVTGHAVVDGRLVVDDDGHPVSAQAYQRHLFQDKSSGVDLVVMNIRAGVGLDLSQAEWVLYSQLPTNYVEYYQSSDRALGINPDRTGETRKVVDVLFMVPTYAQSFIDATASTPDNVYVAQGTPAEIMYRAIMGEDRARFELVMEGIQVERGVSDERALTRLVHAVRGFLEDPSMSAPSAKKKKEMVVSSAFYPLYRKIKGQKSYEDQVLSLVEMYAKTDVSPTTLGRALGTRANFDPDDLKFIVAIFDIPNKQHRDYLLGMLPDLYGVVWQTFRGFNEMTQRGPPELAILAESQPELVVPFIAACHFWNAQLDEEDVYQPTHSGSLVLMQILEEFYSDGFSDFDRRQWIKRYAYALTNLIDLQSDAFLDFLVHLQGDILDEGQSLEDKIKFFEELGILRGANPPAYQQILQTRTSFEAACKAVEQAIQTTFVEMFDLPVTPETMDRIRALAREWGSLDAPVQLMAKLLSGSQRVYGEHVALFKKVVQHIIDGTYREWRNLERRDLTGHEIPYRSDDAQFWSIFNREEMVGLGNVSVTAKDFGKVQKRQMETLLDRLRNENALNDAFSSLTSLIQSDLADSEAEQKLRDALRQKGSQRQALERNRSEANVEAAIEAVNTELANLNTRLRIVQLVRLLEAGEIDGMNKIVSSLAKVIPEPKAEEENRQHISVAIRELQGTLEQQGKAQKFEDVTVQITSDPNLIMRRGMLHEELKNCFNLHANVVQIATLVDDLAAKNKMLAVVRVGGRVASVAILKIRQTEEGQPVIMIERPLFRWGYNFEREIAQSLIMTKMSQMPDTMIAGDWYKGTEKLRQIHVLSTGARGPTEYHETLFGRRMREARIRHIAGAMVEARTNRSRQQEEQEGITRIQIQIEGRTYEVLGIGHSNRTESQFLSLLKQIGADTVVDVRTNPMSRYNPHFNRGALERKLAENDIGYAWQGENLGGKAPGYEEQFDRYIADNPSGRFTKGLEALLSAIKTKKGPICLMCSEKALHDCHRRFILDELVKRYGTAGERLPSEGPSERPRQMGLFDQEGGSPSSLLYLFLTSRFIGLRPTPLVKAVGLIWVLLIEIPVSLWILNSANFGIAAALFAAVIMAHLFLEAFSKGLHEKTFTRRFGGHALVFGLYLATAPFIASMPLLFLIPASTHFLIDAMIIYGKELSIWRLRRQVERMDSIVQQRAHSYENSTQLLPEILAELGHRKPETLDLVRSLNGTGFKIESPNRLVLWAHWLRYISIPAKQKFETLAGALRHFYSAIRIGEPVVTIVHINTEDDLLEFQVTLNQIQKDKIQDIVAVPTESFMERTKASITSSVADRVAIVPQSKLVPNPTNGLYSYDNVLDDPGVKRLAAVYQLIENKFSNGQVLVVTLKPVPYEALDSALAQIISILTDLGEGWARYGLDTVLRAARKAAQNA